MATERITDQQILESVSTDASVLVIQKNEAGKEVLYETTLENFVEALKESGITEDCMKTDDYKSEDNPLIQEIVVSEEKFSVKYLNGETVEYAADIFPEINSVKNTFGIFLEKIEEVEDGKVVSAGARITFDNFVKVLKESKLLEDMQKASEFEKLKPSIIKRVSVSSEKIVIEKLDGTSVEYRADIYPLVNTMTKDNTLFVSMSEEKDGTEVINTKRITLENLVAVLKEAGINSGLMTTEAFEKQKANIVKSVTLKDNVIGVVMLTGRKYEYTIDTTFFDSASVDDEGYLHITKAGKDVIPAILIPALKEKTAEITCKKVGYIFEEETE